MSNQYNSQLVEDMARRCKPFCAEDNNRLYPLVAAGGANARRQMIEGNMALAIAKVENFVRCLPNVAHLRDDLTSAAFIGLTKAVNQMAKGCQIRQPESWNPTDCIAAWINREIRRSIEDETPIRVPQESKRRARKRGESIDLPKVTHNIPNCFETPSHEKELDMRDLIESCCTRNEERTYLAMVEAGYTFVAIASTINKSCMFTQKIGRQLAAKVQRKLTTLCNK